MTGTLPTSLVNQAGVSAAGDVIGRDKFELHLPVPASPIERLLRKLELEVANNEQVRNTFELLAHYYNKRSHDGIDGLEAKLTKADRKAEYFDALEKKELFAKQLERWSLFASAQQIFAYLLAKAEHEFNYIIHPQIGTLTKLEVNQLVTEKIVVPVVTECGSDVFAVNHSVAMGMIYWLAEQCYVRWHQ
ncbi:MAG: hypothetical protein PSV22_13370 [Pseudolabrys sp.]|nr:hypothetical protein [Pseudolabrys sp.]